MIDIIKTKRWVTPLNRDAFLYVALPRSYSHDINRRYPVLYVHDGHNLFYPEDSYGGVTWGMQQTMARDDIAEFIVVALSCAVKGHARLEEYNVFDSRFPSHPTWIARGRGHAYLTYLLETLKDEIDTTYRTLPQREHTYMMGSSMGGVISLEAAFLYSHKVGHIAGLSNAFYASVHDLSKMIHEASVYPLTIYLDTGDQEEGLEVTTSYLSSNRTIANAIHERHPMIRFHYEEIRGGIHHESSWQQRLPDILHYVFQTSPTK
jgi:predicted alpha/beta superfamily hydrolase